jgi:hypothetical protein
MGTLRSGTKYSTNCGVRDKSRDGGSHIVFTPNLINLMTNYCLITRLPLPVVFAKKNKSHYVLVIALLDRW